MPDGSDAYMDYLNLSIIILEFKLAFLKPSLKVS